MLPAFCYERAVSVDEAVDLLARYGPDARILAGGTDLLIGIEDGTIPARRVIDVKGIPDLHGISVSESGETSIGACTTINEIIEAGNLPPGTAAVIEAASVLATYQIRNRATVGGNICNASPACDLGPPFLVLKACLRMVSGGGERTVPLRDFFSGVKQTCCGPEELVTHITLPPLNGTVSAFRKRQRIGGHDLALVNAAAAFSGDGGSSSPGKGKSAGGGKSPTGLRIAVGAVATTPLVIDGFDGLGPGDAKKVVRKVMDSISPIDDVRSSRRYREGMVGFLIRELLGTLREAVG